MGQSYRDLIAWQKAMDFVMDVYRTSKAFPREEMYGLASQLRRIPRPLPGRRSLGQKCRAIGDTSCLPSFDPFLAPIHCVLD